MTKKQNSRNLSPRMIACVLSVCLLLCTLAACQDPADPTNGTSFPTTPPSPTAEPTEPTPPAPTEPAPTEPAPTKPAPTEPAPTEPAPTEPVPTEPTPTEPAPTEPAPTEPTPTEPAPTEPAPTEPAPTEPAPTDPPEVDYSWLLGTWTNVARYDLEDSISTLGILSISFYEDGSGSIDDNGYTNFDIINQTLVDHWIAPGDLAFTSEEISYKVEDGRLAITFIYHEFGDYEPFTVYFPIPEAVNGTITLGEPAGNIHDSALGGALPGTTFVKEPATLEEICNVLGVNYSLPPVEDKENDPIPQWLIGSWETAWRDDANNGGQPYLITSGFVFLEDGTGYTLGHEYWAWDMENNCPASTWDSVPMGFPSSYFIYSISGDQLTISETGDDFGQYEPPYPTQVYTVTLLDNGYMVLNAGGRTYAPNISDLEQLCNTLGVDYSLPQIEESPYTQQLLQDSWHTTIRNDLGKGVVELRTYSIEFDADGTGYYYLSSHLINRSYGKLTSSWNKQSITRLEYIKFRYTLSGEQIYVSIEDGRHMEYKIDIQDQIMELSDLRSGEILRFATDSSFHYIDKLCELIGVSYDTCRPISIEKLVGNIQTIWRDDSTNAYSTLYHASFRFNADGTGELTRQGYIAWDPAQNCALDHWVADPALSHTCSFTYSLDRYNLDISFTCGDPGCRCGSFIAYCYNDNILYLHAPNGEADLPFAKLLRTEKNYSAEDLCAILDVAYAVNPGNGQASLPKKALIGTWKTASRSYATISVWSYTFREDGTGEYWADEWRTRDDYGHDLGKWELYPHTSNPVSFVYTLKDNTLTIKASLYRDYLSIYTYHLAKLSDDTLMMIPQFDEHTQFVYADPDPTLEQICTALGVDLSLESQ